jgi:hypothetical protein
MSRGPGTLGRRILAELEAAPGGRLQWRFLKQRFPRQVEDKGFYASIRSLKRLGRILDHGEGDTRYIYLAPVYHAGGRAHLAFEEDRTFAELCDEVDALLASVYKARAVPPPAPPESASATLVEAYLHHKL